MYHRLRDYFVCAIVVEAGRVHGREAVLLVVLLLIIIARAPGVVVAAAVIAAGFVVAVVFAAAVVVIIAATWLTRLKVYPALPATGSVLSR